MDGSICAAESEPVSPTPESNCGEEAPTSSANGTSYCQQILKIRFPGTKQLANIKLVNFISEIAIPDRPRIITASPPCQPFSNDGNRLAADDHRNCFPDVFRAIGEFQPDFAIIENVAGLLTCPYSPGDKPGTYFGFILDSLSSCGYDAEWSIVSSAHFAAPWRRERLIIIAITRRLEWECGSPTPWEEQIGDAIESIGADSRWGSRGPGIPRSWLQSPSGLDESTGEPDSARTGASPGAAVLIDPKSESPAETETTATEEKPSEMPSTGELQPLGLNELNISVILPPNIGALSKAELIGMAGEQHQLICGIERKQFKLAFEKLYRIHVTGLFLMEFKKRCQYGEFVEQLEAHGINPRVAQNYMMVSKNWETIEAKAHQSALLSENNESPNLGINWALQIIREEKKQLKQQAPPKSSDDWRTPNTTDQPVVKLVRKALGGDIWLDPCSGSGSSIPASVRYWKNTDGLAQHNTWSKTVFINPPFSDPLPWVERCCFEIARGNVSAAVMLLKSGTISNLKTGELINKYASAICHWRGRINFLNDEGNAVKGVRL
jgi:DNA (cytosine-5)-methyltransferase 1